MVGTEERLTWTEKRKRGEGMVTIRVTNFSEMLYSDKKQKNEAVYRKWCGVQRVLYNANLGVNRNDPVERWKSDTVG